jgi:hypothetical protein
MLRVDKGLIGHARWWDGVETTADGREVVTDSQEAV